MQSADDHAVDLPLAVRSSTTSACSRRLGPGVGMDFLGPEKTIIPSDLYFGVFSSLQQLVAG
jgi:hypothetical protein